MPALRLVYLHLFVLLFLGFSTVGSVAQGETGHVLTDINCKKVNVDNANLKFLPGTNVPFTIYFGEHFIAPPRLLVSVGLVRQILTLQPFLPPMTSPRGILAIMDVHAPLQLWCLR